MTDEQDLETLLATVPRQGQQIRSQTQRSFAALNARLAESGADRYTRYFNMGYRDIPGGDTDTGPRTLPGAPRGFNRDAARLVTELVGNQPLAAARVLDVGCGRGGAIELIRQYTTPELVVGLDLAYENVASARRRNANVVQGDSERLPFATGIFDVILNLESSQFYPDPTAFFLEVRRLLKDHGRFLYGDCFVASQFAAVRDVLELCGFTIESQRDISLNVLASRAAVGTRHSKAVGGDVPGDVFVGAPTSTTFGWLERGDCTYQLLRLVAVRDPDPLAARARAHQSALGSAASALAQVTDEWSAGSR